MLKNEDTTVMLPNSLLQLPNPNSKNLEAPVTVLTRSKTFHNELLPASPLTFMLALGFLSQVLTVASSSHANLPDFRQP